MMPMRRTFTVLFLLVPLTVAGCGLFMSKETRALRKSPDYRSGYNDGCNSGYGPDANRTADTMVRDAEMYRTNKAYRLGWHRGNNACRVSGSSNAAQGLPTNAGPIPDRNPGGGSTP